MSELLWIAVPGGIEEDDAGTQALLRVLIVPRLDGSSLETEGLLDWPPPGLAQPGLKIDFAEHPGGELHTFSDLTPRLQVEPGAWQAFFGPGTTLQPARSRGAAMPEVEVDPTTGQAQAIQATFVGVARAKVSLDPTSQAEYEQAVRRELQTHWSGAEAPSRSPGTPLPAGRTPEPHDFHRTLGMLREHPRVLRALGLIFELRLPAALLPADFTQGVVRVGWPTAPASLPEVVSPWTQYERAGGRFLPAATDDIRLGMVALSRGPNGTGAPGLEGSRWQVAVVDVDGGVQRLQEAAKALRAEDDGPARPVSLPALRTAGLMLLRRGRQEVFADRRRSAEDNARRGSMNEAVLTADNLTLGYRLDVRTSGGQWMSLQEREASYFVGEQPIGGGMAIEEGHIKAHAAVRQGDGPLRADEVVARWSGWSLAVPQPALDGGAGRSVPQRRAGLPFDFTWHFNVPKAGLPRLKFANQYQLRLRVADIAGGGLALNDPSDDSEASELIHYLRYEPVASPALVLPAGIATDNLGPGEAVDLVVIRSEPGQSAAEFAAQNPGYNIHPTRVLLPPLAPLTLAGQHPDILEGNPEKTFEQLQRAIDLAGLQAGAGGAASPGQVSVPDPAAKGVAAFPRREPGDVQAGLALSEYAQPWPDLNPKELALSEPQAASGPVQWQGEQLNVRLAPGEQAVVELSAFLDGNFLDHFAAKELMPKESESAALAGRHPLLTPARTVRLVHAVRRPINDPGGKLEPLRQPGETFTRLDPQPAGLEVDPHSTARLEITAAWTEFNDEITTSVEGAPVQSVTIGRGDQALRETLRHEFGDTRHRQVRYTLTAVSRFRQFFDQDEDAERFLARTPLPAVPVPSTARPAPPVVLATSPSFHWEQENLAMEGSLQIFIRRRRRAGLRVELGRPWFLSGEGERLAIVVGPGGEPSEDIRPFLTQAGRDPIWDTPIIDHWCNHDDFAGTSGEPESVLLEETGGQVVAVPYEVIFHEDRWYADIAMPRLARDSYSPFVRLAVARYQPESLPNLKLSRIVHTEMVPLLPARTLTVKTLTNLLGFEITLEGLGPLRPRPNRVDLIVEQCLLPLGMQANAIHLAALSPVSDEIPAWVVRGSTSGNLDSNIQVRLPALEAGPLRIRIREVEQIGPEVEAPATQMGTEAELTERTVFTDVFTVEVP